MFGITEVGEGSSATIEVNTSSDNYWTFSGVITIEAVNKKFVEITGIEMPNGVYNGEPHGYTGTPVFIRSDNEETVTDVTFEILYESIGSIAGVGYYSETAPTNAGAYRLTLKVSYGDPTYIGDREFEFTIAKANPPYTAPTNLTALVGQTLEDVTLPAGWSWVTPTDLVGAAGVRTHKAKFTPTDINNYDVVDNIDVTVIVSAASVSISNPVKSGDGLGIIFERNVVDKELKIVKVVISRESGREVSARPSKTVIYDNAGNVVYSGTDTKWDLRNKSGRIAANGGYLVIVEAKDRNGNVYYYSAKVVVKR
jgi:hypothetical protein